MGIDDFTKVFEPKEQDVALSSLKGKTIAIDAFSEIYRMSLGVKHQSVMTDANGQSTAHLNSLIAFIIKLHRNGIKQIWIFDYIGSAPASTPEKAIEIQKRKKAKIKAALEQEKLFLDDTEITDDTRVNDTSNEIVHTEVVRDPLNLSDEKKEKYYKLEKRTWRPSQSIIDDFILVLDCFCIPYAVAPPGFEGECICTLLVKKKTADAVYSGDSDPIAFGATVLLKYEVHKKQINMYTQDSILEQLAKKLKKAVTLDDIQKTAVILGCDFSDRTPGAGPKRFPNYFDKPLSEDQKKGIIAYNRFPDQEIKLFNSECTQFKDDKRQQLFEWLTTEKGFSADRINKCWFSQIDKPLKVTKPRKKTVPAAAPAPKPRPKKRAKTAAKSGADESSDLMSRDDGQNDRQDDNQSDDEQNDNQDDPTEDVIGVNTEKNKSVFVSSNEEELDL